MNTLVALTRTNFIKGLLMKNFLDDQTIELTCPNCSHKLKERIGKLKTNPKLACTKCSSGINIDASHMRGEVAKVEQALAKLQRTLGSFAK